MIRFLTCITLASLLTCSSLRSEEVSGSFTIGEGTVAIHLARENDAVTGNIALENIPLAALQSSNSPHQIVGSVSGAVTLSGTVDEPLIEASLKLHNIGIDHGLYSKLPPGFGEITAAYDGKHLSLRGAASADGYPPLTFTFTVPATVTLDPFQLTFDEELPIAGQVSLRGEVAELIRLATKTPIPLSGTLAADITVGGTLASPEATGRCTLSDGRYEIPEIGLLIAEMRAVVEAQGTLLEIKEVTGTDGSGGGLSGNGWLELSGEKKFPFEAQIAAEHAKVLSRDYTTLICSGTLTFAGTAEGATIAGNLHLDEGMISIPDRPAAVINSVDVTYINVPKDDQPQTEEIKHPPYPMTLDIHLDIPDNLPIAGRDLTSTWRGDIAITGTPQHPLLEGQLKIVEGQYLFNGNPFEIRKGAITFAGDLEKKTTMYVTATKDLDRVKVDVIAKGPVTDPTLTFRSNPPMPQREILSWMLFGRGTSEISQFQGTQLTESVTNLKTNQQGPDVISKLRSTFGIDRFEFCRNPESEDNDVNIQVGKYICEGVLVSVIKSDVNRLAIEAAVTNRIKAQAQVGDDGEAQLFLKWKRNY